MQQYVEMPTKKGTVRGFMHIPNRSSFPVVIMFHGFSASCIGTKFSYVKLSRMLEGQGIASIRMDFLGSGESDLYFNEMTFDDELSVARMILEEMVKMESVTKIYVLGHSMGGAIACELAKLYPDVIEKLCLWAPALNLPELFTTNEPMTHSIDVWGLEVGVPFLQDITKRNLYENLNVYQNPLLVIHGTKDTTVDFAITKKYIPLMHEPVFIPFENADHSFNKVEDLLFVLKKTYEFFVEEKIG